MCIFDRTWYGRLLVERVEGFASVPDWRRAYEEIRHWESLLVSDGTILIKFFLHISSKEQKRRFDSRAKDPLRQWKLTDEDWRNRKKRQAYEEAIEEMVQKTDTVLSPWTLVAAESKRFARIKVPGDGDPARRGRFGLTGLGCAAAPGFAHLGGGRIRKKVDRAPVTLLENRLHFTRV